MGLDGTFLPHSPALQWLFLRNGQGGRIRSRPRRTADQRRCLEGTFHPRQCPRRSTNQWRCLEGVIHLCPGQHRLANQRGGPEGVIHPRPGQHRFAKQWRCPEGVFHLHPCSHQRPPQGTCFRMAWAIRNFWASMRPRCGVLHPEWRVRQRKHPQERTFSRMRGLGVGGKPGSSSAVPRARMRHSTPGAPSVAVHARTRGTWSRGLRARSSARTVCSNRNRCWEMSPRCLRQWCRGRSGPWRLSWGSWGRARRRCC